MLYDNGGSYKDSKGHQSSSPHHQPRKWLTISPKWMVRYGSILFGWFNTSFNKNSKNQKISKISIIFPYFFIESWMCWIIFISWGLGGCHQRQRARVPAGSGCGARSAATAGRGAALFTLRRCETHGMLADVRCWSCDSGVSGDGYCHKIWDVLNCWIQSQPVAFASYFNWWYCLLQMFISLSSSHITNWSMSPTSEEHGFCDRWLNDEPVIWGLHIPTHPTPLKKRQHLTRKEQIHS